VYVSSAVENAAPSVLEITYDQTLANIVPAASAFTVLVNSVGRTVNTVSISDTKVRLTLASAVVYGDIIFTKVKIDELWKQHIRQHAIATLLLTTSSRPSEKGTVKVEGNKILTFTQKPKKSDIYEQLFVCDLMITKHSTTAMEAAALNKPVIVLNLSGEPDIVDFVDQKIAVGVYEEKDFKPSAERLLKDDKELKRNRKAFINNYLYKVDGKATERVVNTLKEKLDEIYK
jgi:hypothetical protein